MAAATVIDRMAAGFSAMLFPHECVACGREGSVLCRDCQDETGAPLRGVFLCPVCGRRTPLGSVCPGACRGRSALAGAVALAPYGHPVLRRLLQEYKYDGVEQAGGVLEVIWTSWLVRQKPLLSAVLGQATVLPVPLHYYRRARRGFNQADIFAAAIGRVAGADVVPDALTRKIGWRTQVGAGSPALRQTNVRGSVAIRPGTVVRGDYLVVDDVLTSGSTAQECARVLRRAGAGRVWALTLLRG